MSAFETSKHSVFSVKNISKCFLVPNLNSIGEELESLNDIIGVSLPGIQDYIIEEGIIEPYGFEAERMVMGVERGLISV